MVQSGNASIGAVREGGGNGDISAILMETSFHSPAVKKELSSNIYFLSAQIR